MATVSFPSSENFAHPLQRTRRNFKITSATCIASKDKKSSELGAMEYSKKLLFCSPSFLTDDVLVCGVVTVLLVILLVLAAAKKETRKKKVYRTS